MEEKQLLEGNISVKAALQGKKRKIYEMIVDVEKKDRDTNFILQLAKKENIVIHYKNREYIDNIAEGNSHGGLIAFAGARTYQTLDPFFTKNNVYLAYVDGIEDPFNFGYILRTLYASGCDGVIVGERNWSSATTTVTKSSAGASEYIPIIPSSDILETIQLLKEHSIAFICAHRNDAISLYEYSFPQSFCIAIGGEMRGISKKVLVNSEQNLYIPYENDFKNALNAASATSVFSFEILRQRTYK